MNEHLAGEIDYLVNADVGDRNNRPLHAALDGTPACWRAAGTMLEAVDPGDSVLCTTGFPITDADAAETDGPPGAVALARAVAALGGQPVFCVDDLTAPVVTSLAEAADLTGAPVEMVPRDRDAAAGTAARLLDRYEPACCLAVERPGRCSDGTYRNMAGEDVSDAAGKVDELFTAATEAGIPTVGVGDGGNEIGMGAVADAVRTHVPHGDTIASRTETDVLVVAGVSNWGAAGVVAALSLRAGRRLLHDGATEQAWIAACVDTGAVDGVTATQRESVDGIGAAVHGSLIDLLGDLVDDHLDGE